MLQYLEHMDCAPVYVNLHLEINFNLPSYLFDVMVR